MSSSPRKRQTTAWSSAALLPLLFLLAAAAPAFGQLLPGTRAWSAVPNEISAWQYRELEAWYEAQYQSAPGGPAPTREDWRRLIGAADYKFLQPKPTVESAPPASNHHTASPVSWPLMQVGSTPSTRGSQVSRVSLHGIYYRSSEPGPRPAIITLNDQDGATAFDHTRHVFALVTAKREAFAQPWIEDRQWLDRLATQSGHTLLGAEVAQVSAVVDFLLGQPEVDPANIGVLGGFEAVAAAAADPRLKLVTQITPFSIGSPLWTLPQDLSVWRQAWGFDWKTLSSWTKQMALTMPWAGSPLAFDTRQAKAYNAMFVAWQAFFRNAALEAYSTRPAQATMEDYLDITGRYPQPAGPLDAESVQIYDTPEVRGYRLSVRVYDGVHAVGILLIPKSLNLARRHPMVFVQHGLGGKPEDALGVEKTKEEPVYRAFGLELARRGYLVFAPMISTQTVIGRNELVRRARPLGLTVAGMERTKFSRLLDFFATLPFVDAARIGFYGLSYGGYTALWTTPGEPRFKVVVCSGHFNDWTAKTTDLTMGSSYMFYADHLDMYNYGLLPRFSHAELAALIKPRPLLIEMGSDDGVMAAPRRLVDMELARSGAEVARFQGPHRIDGVEAFAFLDRHLQPSR